MKTKEAIEFLKSSRMYVGYQDEKDLFKIINLLQRGEAYREMWEQLVKMWGVLPTMEAIEQVVEQKHFPKELKS